ncbi:hypothetical protein ACWD0A_27645 [Streptomyces sp. NPDC002867]
MNPRIRCVTAAVLAGLATAALASCSSSNSPSDKSAAGPSTTELVTKSAHDYMHAWMAVEPSNASAMCKLQTKAARPNFDKDGGTLQGCIAERETISAGSSTDPSRGALDITISHVQDVPASATHPAGKGALATMKRPDEDQFRYALRLVKEGDTWLIEQTTDVGERYAQTADPVAPVLAQQTD